MDIPLLRDQVIDQLWLAYKKTSEYENGQTKAIPTHHGLVEKQEKTGLREIYIHFVSILEKGTSLKKELKERTIGQWLSEWKKMHESLFRHVLKKNGEWREIFVRFGSPGDEDLHHVPLPKDINREISQLAKTISQFLNEEELSVDDKFRKLAIIHYQFIRIHPFPDGNGRIARALTDQLAIFFGFPVAMGGYPRRDNKRRLAYHHAINSCINDPSCTELAMWIRSYVDRQLQQLA